MHQARWMTKISVASLKSIVAILILASGFAATPQEASVPDRISYEGTLGGSRIGLTLIVKAGNTITAGHYFYAKYLTDIPLAGTMQPGTVTLKGKDGGTFDLKFKGNGSEGGKPMDFNNSVGLEGTWSNDGKSRPVTLGLRDIASVDGPWYKVISNQTDAAFEAKAQGFYKAVIAGDRATAAKYVSYPLMVNLKGKTLKIHSAAELTAQWDTIFTPQYLERLKKDMPHDMAIAKGQAMIGSGDAWFDDKGATSLNVF